MSFLSTLKKWFFVGAGPEPGLTIKPVVEEDLTPRANVSYVAGKLYVKDYNKAFVDDLRVKLGAELTDDKTDEEIVNLFVSRENIEQEEPYLNVVHSGIDADGRIKMKLDWNHSFINLLKKNGITGENDEEAIHRYLLLLTHNKMDELVGEGGEDKVDVANLSAEQINAAFSEMDIVTNRELEEAESQAKNQKRTRRRRKTT